MKKPKMRWGNHHLSFEGKPLIMGIVNITPDSFSDGGVFFNRKAAIEQGIKLANDGADILDIGGESTRPFSDPVSREEEIRRVVPVIEALAEKTSIPISIDTTKAPVAKMALDAGASIVNDISALSMDKNMASVVRDYDVPVILMHMLGNPKTMQLDPSYENVIEDIYSFLDSAIQRAEKRGLDRSKIIIDPGIGFGKTPTHNLLLVKQMARFSALSCPILIGPSRKAFIRHLLKKATEKDILPDSPEVETGTQAIVAVSALYGADILRVHNVAATKATVKIIDAIRTAASPTA